MKTNLIRSLFAVALLCAAPFASAQATLELHDFTAFADPATTFFVGDWAVNEANGDFSPIPTFSQGAGSYNFVGGSNSDTAGVFYFFTSNPGNLAGYSLLQVSARLLAGNTASTFTVSLFDTLGESAFAVFSTAAFAGGAGFTTVSSALTYSPGFDRADLASFQITGGVLGGQGTLNLAVDRLAVAVPEPSTYGALGALALVALIGVRRFRRRV